MAGDPEGGAGRLDVTLTTLREAGFTADGELGEIGRCEHLPRAWSLHPDQIVISTKPAENRYG